MPTIESILKQYHIGGMQGLPTASIISFLYLGESEAKHQADMQPRDAAHFTKEAARYSDAAKAIKELIAA